MKHHTRDMVRRTAPRRSQSDQRGISLIEVMIALTIAAITLTSLSLGIIRYLNQHAELRDRIWAQNIALNAVVTLQLQQARTLSGSENQLQQTWQWRGEVFPTPESSIDRIDIRVARNTRDLILMEAYLFRL